ncbi:hypothetical protein HG535_0B01600 [Zygotorulaspora mrakii]|uniref:Zn(2)-C6 fungal-type domain-containing protein n=1 Tax=Zygotorulaspora mrakii TaxID=42260 RepID=A0A7H9AZZ9_ZYGMR|nr:uncharacterized protein HG535_0B01600 [Zygotorulaspora mrakii]QLG71122.1 hypothetical protein HG535_0B01600 [Zygotorulaspora mrakii]
MVELQVEQDKQERELQVEQDKQERELQVEQDKQERELQVEQDKQEHDQQLKAKLLAPLRGRTFSGCWACRLRKRRCDEMRPRCSYCIEHNIKCCYDVRLVWLEENSYRISLKNNSEAQLVRMSQMKRKRCCIDEDSEGTKQRKLTTSNSQSARVALSPPNSESEIEEEPDDKKTLPVPIDAEPELELELEQSNLNIRRLQTYDNHVKSVYGTGRVRNYDQKSVNKTLNGLLRKLENHSKNSFKNSGISTHKEGPFSVFDMHFDDESISINNNIPSPPMNNHTQKNTNSFQELHERKEFIDCLVENKIYTILWLNTHGNMILSREEYCKWFLGYMKRILPFEFCKVLEKIISDANPFNISNWLSIIKNKWLHNPDWQTVSFTLLTVVHGYTCPELSSELENWFLTQSILQYSMYPLINFIVRNSTNLILLYHCNVLLNNNNECSQDIYQDELTNELNVLVTKKVVNIWRDRILKQLCSCEDTTKSCSQLKYWELQLKYNEIFYTDVYST